MLYLPTIILICIYLRNHNCVMSQTCLKYEQHNSENLFINVRSMIRAKDRLCNITEVMTQYLVYVHSVRSLM